MHNSPIRLTTFLDFKAQREHARWPRKAALMLAALLLLIMFTIEWITA